MKFLYDESLLARLHPKIHAQHRVAARKRQLLHTVYYGPRGIGKLALAYDRIATFKRVQYESVMRVQNFTVEYNGLTFPVRSSAVHFEIDLDHIPRDRAQSAIVSYINDLGATRDVSQNHYKILVVNNAELMTMAVQRILRRQLET